MESARPVTGLVRIMWDVCSAEELSQDPLVAALQQWPKTGIPQNHEPWLAARWPRVHVTEERPVLISVPSSAPDSDESSAVSGIGSELSASDSSMR